MKNNDALWDQVNQATERMNTFVGEIAKAAGVRGCHHEAKLMDGTVLIFRVERVRDKTWSVIVNVAAGPKEYRLITQCSLETKIVFLEIVQAMVHDYQANVRKLRRRAKTALCFSFINPKEHDDAATDQRSD
ncbi:MAG: hypothetical protein ACREJ6_04320 [Candidatus Methylomirabilis sp.]